VGTRACINCFIDAHLGAGDRWIYHSNTFVKGGLPCLGSLMGSDYSPHGVTGRQKGERAVDMAKPFTDVLLAGRCS